MGENAIASTAAGGKAEAVLRLGQYIAGNNMV